MKYSGFECIDCTFFQKKGKYSPENKCELKGVVIGAHNMACKDFEAV